MEKIQVSREVADFIDKYEKNLACVPGWKDHLIMEHSRNWYEDFENSKEEAMCMSKISPLMLSRILIYGFEVEESPEERLVKLFHDPATSYEYEDDAAIRMRLQTAFRHGVKTALKILDIKVKGINA